ncbi:hypothetical protein [Synechococcus sp. 1G10]|uniref:hypothetical protein n=1 Tax=Synechococcus sp. 1G10 TaxID=2025605 RepID=UPI00118169A8|nr:hypothetical protein [Synechococcus sp. 1G10]
MLVGTDCAFVRRAFDLKQSDLDCSGLLDRAQQTTTEVFIALIPLTSPAEANQFIPPANQAFQRLIHSRGIPFIDLSPTISPEGALLARFIFDGMHYTEPAYRLRRAEIAAAVRHSKAR